MSVPKDIKSHVLLCVTYTPVFNITKDDKPNCTSCDYQSGTKCEDVHRKIAQEEERYDAYGHMIVGNRGIFL